MKTNSIILDKYIKNIYYLISDDRSIIIKFSKTLIYLRCRLGALAYRQILPNCKFIIEDRPRIVYQTYQAKQTCGTSIHLR